MSDEQQPQPNFRVIDGGAPKKKREPWGGKRGRGGARWDAGKNQARSTGLDAYEKAAAAYVKFPGNHAQAARACGLDPRTCRRMYELGLLDTQKEPVAPPIKELVAERARLIRERTHGDVARQHEHEQHRDELRRQRAQAEREEMAAFAAVRRLSLQFLSGALRGAELVDAMLATQLARFERVKDEATGKMVLQPLAGEKVEAKEVARMMNVYGLSAQRMAQVARVLHAQGVKDRDLFSKGDKDVDSLPAEVLNEQAEALAGSSFIGDLAAGRVRFPEGAGG